MVEPVRVKLTDATLDGDLTTPANASGIVLFAHGSGSGRHSSRNKYVARVLNEAGLATLLFDLLTLEEEAIDERTRHLRFDIEMLGRRVIGVTDWIMANPSIGQLPIGLFGASTGAAAALIAAAERPAAIGAVVSRGGRPDLAERVLHRVRAPTLLIVGGDDTPVIGMNESAYDLLACEKRMEIIPGATHLFEEPGALEQVGELAATWFSQHLPRRRPQPRR